MQKGRGYRAARPRNNLVDAAYSERLPYRCTFRGSILYDGMGVTSPSDQSSPCTFDSMGPTWRLESTFHTTGLPDVFASLEYTPDLPGGDARVELLLDDHFGSTVLFKWHLIYPVTGVPIANAWPTRNADEKIVTGSSLDSFGCWIWVIVYADEH
jgi:hypothetical protein